MTEGRAIRDEVSDPKLGAVLDAITQSRDAIRANMTWTTEAMQAIQWPVDHRKEALEYERRWRAATRRLGSLPAPGYESHAVFTARGAHDLACKHLIAAINERLKA